MTVENLNSRERLLYEIKSGNMKELGDVEGSFECSVCKCFISGLTQAELHACGTKHQKKLNLRSSYNIYNTPGLSISSGSDIGKDNHDKEISNGCDYFCNVCKISFTGNIPKEQHYAGKAHKKELLIAAYSSSRFSTPAVSKRNCTTISSSRSPIPFDRPSSPAIEPVSDSDLSLEDTHSVIKIGRDKHEMCNGSDFICHVCEMSFTGIIPMEQHYGGKAHKKQLKVAQSSSPPPVSKRTIFLNVSSRTPTHSDLPSSPAIKSASDSDRSLENNSLHLLSKRAKSSSQPIDSCVEINEVHIVESFEKIPQLF